MSDYRRSGFPGPCHFFTVACRQRQPVFARPAAINLLRQCMRSVRIRRPFDFDAIVVLPDHLHCIWRLPEGDSDFRGRWREIKKAYTRRAGLVADLGARTPWQNRFRERVILEEAGWRRHIDYIHLNPVRHGLVQRPGDWPFSSFHAACRRGWYPPDWGADGGPHLPTPDLPGPDLD